MCPLRSFAALPYLPSGKAVLFRECSRDLAALRPLFLLELPEKNSFSARRNNRSSSNAVSGPNRVWVNLDGRMDLKSRSFGGRGSDDPAYLRDL
jgi:hypothetical protein